MPVEQQKRIDCLDKGYVELIDVFGDDLRPAKTAKTSYNKGKDEVDNIPRLHGLNDYLIRHKHCYHPDMEVLTELGWKKWSDLGKSEVFLVPDPSTQKMHKEKCEVLSFEVEEDLYAYKGRRCSYKVTSGHKMWYKPKKGYYVKDSYDFDLYPVENLWYTGNLQPIKDFILGDNDLTDYEPTCTSTWKLVGMYLGDGSCYGVNFVTFHFKKERKIEYVIQLLEDLNIPYKLNYSSDSSVNIVFHKDYIHKSIDLTRKAKEKIRTRLARET